MRAQIEAVLTDQALGQLGVPVLQRLDDVHMVDHRPRHPVILEDSAYPDRAHVKEQVLGHLRQKLAVTHFDDRLMESDIDFRILVDLGLCLAVFEGDEHVAKRRDLGVVGLKRDEPRRHALERRPYGDHIEDFAFRLADDERPPSRHRADEAFLLEPRDRLADWRSTDTEFGRKSAFVEP